MQVLQKKANHHGAHGSIKPILDYRCLNKMTKIEAAPIPRYYDLLKVTKGAKCHLNMFSAYNHVQLDEESLSKTAIVSTLDDKVKLWSC